jgi:hypothetical protein
MDADNDEQVREEIRRKIRQSQDDLVGDEDKPEEQRRKTAEGPDAGPLPPNPPGH